MAAHLHARRITILLSGIFLSLLAVLHWLEPEFDPTWRMISEYELGRFGWLMSLAFFCWAGSVFTLVLALRPHVKTTRGWIGLGWLGVLVVALVGAGVFRTNAITDPTPNASNSLHTLCGALVILTFPIAATLLTADLGGGLPAPARHYAGQPHWSG